MATKRFDVEARLRARGLSDFQRYMKSAGIAARGAARHFDSMRRSVRALTLGVGVGGLYAVGMAARKLARDLYEIPSAVNDAQRGIAILSQTSFGIKNYEDARKAAAGIYDELMRISDVSPGNIFDYLESFRDIAALAQGTKSSVSDLLDLTKNLVALEKVYGFQAGVVSRDVRQILGGMGNIALIQTPQFKNISLAAAKMARAGDKAGALRIISQAAAIDPAAIHEYGLAWSAQIDTLRNNYIRFMKVAGTPVLEWLTKHLQLANLWFKRNKRRAAELAHILATKAKAALEWIKGALKTIYQNWGLIVGVVKTLAYLWIAKNLYSALAMVVDLLRAGYRLILAYADGINQVVAAHGPWKAALGGILVLVTAIVGGIVAAARAQAAFARQTRAAVGGGYAAAAAQLREEGLPGEYGMRKALIGLLVRNKISEKFGDPTMPASLWNAMGPEQRRSELRKIEYEARRAAKYQIAAEQEMYRQGKKFDQDLNLTDIQAAAAANGLTQNVDMRGARVTVEQNFRDEDPDAVFFAFNQGIGAGVVRTVSDRAPRL